MNRILIRKVCTEAPKIQNVAFPEALTNNKYNILIRVDHDNKRVILEHTMNFYEKTVVLPNIKNVFHKVYPSYEHYN